jgi:NAD(P)-dependent dehydrogenase (short-subunit alcohol dehydrogenase family)|tara:strand:- start:748 stop:1479 length:732 start_codon:yes stop_codon:yes gene_type:complete
MTFSLKDKVVVITGGAGLLGKMHAEAVREAGGKPILTDVIDDGDCHYMDVTDKNSIEEFVDKYLDRVDVLINNAALNPKMSTKDETNKFEDFSLDKWNKSLEVNLTGTFLCSQVFINKMIKDKTKGVVINVASDLGVIAPNQNIYDGDVKPVDYSVTKHAIIGLTKYLSTYFGDKNIRVNAISPGGVYTNQSDDFVERLSKLIPMGRMANKDEYKGAIVFLCSEASSYMNGHNLILDGGRTVW